MELVKTVPCKGCGDEIVWLKTQKGKNIPVDADTVTSGDEIFDRNVHTCHFETCPNASQFRRKKE